MTYALRVYMFGWAGRDVIMLWSNKMDWYNLTHELILARLDCEEHVKEGRIDSYNIVWGEE